MEILILIAIYAITVAIIFVGHLLAWFIRTCGVLWREVTDRPPLCWDCGVDLRTVKSRSDWKRGRHEGQRCQECGEAYDLERRRRTCRWCSEEFFVSKDNWSGGSYLERERPRCDRCLEAEQLNLCRTCRESPLMGTEDPEAPESDAPYHRDYRRRRRYRGGGLQVDGPDWLRGQCAVCYWQEEGEPEKVADAISRREHRRQAEQARRAEDAERLGRLRENVTADYQRDQFLIRRQDYKRGNLLDNHFRRPRLTEAVVSSFGGCCLHCGGRDDLTLDHYGIPKNEGGNFVLYVRDSQTVKMNIVPLCRACNSAKGDMPFEVYFRPEEMSRALECHKDLIGRLIDDRTTVKVLRKWYPEVRLPSPSGQLSLPGLPDTPRLM